MLVKFIPDVSMRPLLTPTRRGLEGIGDSFSICLAAKSFVMNHFVSFISRILKVSDRSTWKRVKNLGGHFFCVISKYKSGISWVYS